MTKLGKAYKRLTAAQAANDSYWEKAEIPTKTGLGFMMRWLNERNSELNPLDRELTTARTAAIAEALLVVSNVSDPLAKAGLQDILTCKHGTDHAILQMGIELTIAWQRTKELK